MTDLFEQIFNFDNYKKTQCKRWGLHVDRFSNVMGIILLEGTIYYDSNKNYRSNKTFDEFKTNNVISRKALVYITQSDPEHIFANFGENEEKANDNLDTLMGLYRGDHDCVIYGTGCDKFKFQRSKVFYLKFNDALYASKGDNFLVQNATIECDCNFS